MLELYNEATGVENIHFRSKSNLPLVAAEIFSIIYQGRVMFSFQAIRVRAWLWKLNM